MGLIHYQRGNIFDSDTQVIVNTVNCQGVMGKGLALAFKKRYPEMFPVYQQECQEGRLRIGRPTLYKESTPWILNFPTKDGWRANSKLEYIEKSLEYFVSHYKKVGITSIAFPKLGAQNGKLSWDDVGPLMAQYLGQLDINVYIYITDGDIEYQKDTRVNSLNERIWVQFSELALSPSHLQQDIQLNGRDAKKIATKRTSQQFSSLKDIEDIEGLAQTSLKKIKNYILCQQYEEVELVGMPPSVNNPKPSSKKPRTSPQRKRKGQNAKSDDAKNALFTLESIHDSFGKFCTDKFDPAISD
jgi:O-acetyl-ADP-ribose deacetylase (regulator of RNase III)